MKLYFMNCEKKWIDKYQVMKYDFEERKMNE